MHYGTISPQPIEIHMPHLFGVIIHQPDGWAAPVDGGLSTVLVSDCECVLSTKPALVGREVLKPSLDVVEDGVLRVFDVSPDIIDVPLQATVDVTTQ